MNSQGVLHRSLPPRAAGAAIAPSDDPEEAVEVWLTRHGGVASVRLPDGRSAHCGAGLDEVLSRLVDTWRPDRRWNLYKVYGVDVGLRCSIENGSELHGFYHRRIPERRPWTSDVKPLCEPIPPAGNAQLFCYALTCALKDHIGWSAAGALACVVQAFFFRHFANGCHQPEPSHVDAIRKGIALHDRPGCHRS